MQNGLCNFSNKISKYVFFNKLFFIFLDKIGFTLSKFSTVSQVVRKVLLQFKKFSAKAVDEISYINLFYINQCLLKSLLKLKFFALD